VRGILDAWRLGVGGGEGSSVKSDVLARFLEDSLLPLEGIALEWAVGRVLEEEERLEGAPEGREESGTKPGLGS